MEKPEALLPSGPPDPPAIKPPDPPEGRSQSATSLNPACGITTHSPTGIRMQGNAAASTPAELPIPSGDVDDNALGSRIVILAELALGLLVIIGMQRGWVTGAARHCQKALEGLGVVPKQGCTLRTPVSCRALPLRQRMTSYGLVGA